MHLNFRCKKLHPFLSLKILAPICIDILAKSQVPYGWPINIVCGHFAQNVIIWECYFTAYVWQSTVRRNKGEPRSVFSQNSKHSYIYPVF